MQNIIIALLIVFICLYAAGLVVYAVFFAIHKGNFHRHILVAKKYNELITGLNSINIFKIQVLADNDIGNKLDLNQYIAIYKRLKSNAGLIKANIHTAELELNSFNLTIAKAYIRRIDSDLNKALVNLKTLREGYDRYTQYGDTIEIAFQNYLEIFEQLNEFYQGKLLYYKSFTKINKLIASISKTCESLPELSVEFDYKKTVDTVLDLGRKLKALADVILITYKFQAVDLYLRTTKEYNEKMISKYFDEIDRADLQALQNLLTLFAHAYKHFNQHYRALELAKAKQFAIQAIDAINQVNQFTYIHINTPALIAVSINEIKEQTDKIMAGKPDIIRSIKDLKQYFILEPNILSNFDIIEKNVNYITVLNKVANSINYRTHSEKVRAIKELDLIANQIVVRKSEIIKSIDFVNDSLSKIVKTVTDLNDLYIYFWQLRSAIVQYGQDDTESKAMLQLIDSNVNQIEQYSKQIITEEKTDFDKIIYEISSIIEQSQQIYKRLSTIITLKAYANRLVAYANRYRGIEEFNASFVKADRAFRTKDYDQCVEVLLAIVKAAKKYKNKK
ncbi:MAG: hypothetical protein ACOQNY_01940 [Mycoplasmoidaceae bacterium]